MITTWNDFVEFTVPFKIVVFVRNCPYYGVKWIPIYSSHCHLGIWKAHRKLLFECPSSVNGCFFLSWNVQLVRRWNYHWFSIKFDLIKTTHETKLFLLIWLATESLEFLSNMNSNVNGLNYTLEHLISSLFFFFLAPFFFFYFLLIFSVARDYNISQ